MGNRFDRQRCSLNMCSSLFVKEIVRTTSSGSTSCGFTEKFDFAYNFGIGFSIAEWNNHLMKRSLRKRVV